MLITKEVEMVVTSHNRWRLQQMGYENIAAGAVVKIPIEQLSHGSTAVVQFQCEYCGAIVDVAYCSYNQRLARSLSNKDACRKCRLIKCKETSLNKYGALSSFGDATVRQKIQDTCVERYGTKTPLESSCIQDKCKQTRLEKYGVEHILCSKELLGKAQAAFFEKYGVHNPMQVEEIASKATETRIHNGDTTSKPQLLMYETIKELGYDCQLNYQHHRYSFDVAVFVGNEKIDIEYDGFYWHLGRDAHDAERDQRTLDEGWKVIRFKGADKSTAPPSKTQIRAALNAAIYQNQPIQILDVAG